MYDESTTIDDLINRNLVYTYENQGSTTQETKLGFGGLSSSATQGTNAKNSYAGRGGFVGIVMYSEKPAGYPAIDV